jgi:hypothetical protein
MFPAQPEQDMDDIKLPPMCLSTWTIPNFQPDFMYTTILPFYPFRQRQLEQMVGHFRSERMEFEQTVELLHRERLKQEKKQKDQEQLIKELQRTVKML